MKNKKLLILIIPIYALLIISLIVPVGGYKMDLPGNIQPISKEIEFEDLESSGEFYSIYIISSKPTLFQMLIGYLDYRVDVYKETTYTSSAASFYRGAILEDLSFQYAIINAYLKAAEVDNTITIDYTLNSYIITYSLNDKLKVGTRFTHLDGEHISSFTDEELLNYFKDNDTITLTTLDVEDTVTDIEITKTDGKFWIIYDKYYVINDSNPKYQTHYHKDSKVGPSGGLLQTLEIYATITKRKFNKVISGTGTMEADGSVGRIGGVKQKIFTANKRVDIFFVSEGDYEEALEAYNKIKNPTFELVKVSDFNEALEKLLS